MEPQRPRVGLGVMVFKDGKVLLGRRRGAHGAGEYAFPGGHVEHGETFEACALREVAEEAGIRIANVQFQFTACITAYPPTHYVHIGLTADWAEGEPAVLEPHKCERWNWYDLRNLPGPLFVPCALAFDSHRTGRQYYDAVTDRSIIASSAA